MWFQRPRMAVLLFFTLLCLSQTPALASKKSYVVYLGGHAYGPQLSAAVATDSHHHFLRSFLGSAEKAKNALTYSYSRHINGFSAMLEDQEAAEIAKHPSVVSVFLSQPKKLHTVHSWEFMKQEKDGLVNPKSLWEKASFGEDIIIANLDTGVWPELRSFSDEGYGPLPSKWKGSCENKTRAGIPCNRKLIGAKYYNKGYLAAVGSLKASLNNARDHDGHGSHTLSTAGGNFVPGTDVYGFKNVTPKGGSPKARVASYKVCWPEVNNTGGCFDADLLKAFDTAIHDGVDVLSVSVGGDPIDYFNDAIAIGSFHAVKKGIVVVCSAGNSGPKPGTVSNVAPWIITVGASTLDRDFQTFVELRNGKRLQGTSLSEPMPENRFFPLISGVQAKRANASAKDAELCKPGSLDPKKVNDKILACLRGESSRLDKGWQAAEAGAVGMILCNDKASGNEVIADPHFLPASHLKYTDGLAVLSYINTSSDPLAFITAPSLVNGVRPAPFMAAFSSVGPNTVTPEILKPDVTAPGVNIIAGFSEATSPSGQDFDKRRVHYTTMSGTSMSCPHVAGVVGLLRKLHPDWSPAAIRSAITTTARSRDNTMNPMLDGSSFQKSKPFSHGSGHIRPNRAMDPGLVYDLGVDDYLDFLCALGYNQSSIKALNDDPYECPKSASLLDFNYPSITVPKLSGSVTASRKLKNVGAPGKYQVLVKEPYGISICVEPSALTFDEVGEVKTFRVTLKPKWAGAAKDYEFGGLTWTDGSHFVRTPVVVRTA